MLVKIRTVNILRVTPPNSLANTSPTQPPYSLPVPPKPRQQWNPLSFVRDHLQLRDIVEDASLPKMLELRAGVKVDVNTGDAYFFVN